MAKLPLIWRLAVKDIRRRPVQALLSLLGPGLRGTTINPTREPGRRRAARTSWRRSGMPRHEQACSKAIQIGYGLTHES